MTISEIIEMLRSRIAQLGQLRASAVMLGDLARVASIDSDLAETELTLATLLAAND
jgi:hypothetical protein